MGSRLSDKNNIEQKEKMSLLFVLRPGRRDAHRVRQQKRIEKERLKERYIERGLQYREDGSPCIPKNRHHKFRVESLLAQVHLPELLTDDRRCWAANL